MARRKFGIAFGIFLVTVFSTLAYIFVPTGPPSALYEDAEDVMNRADGRSDSVYRDTKVGDELGLDPSTENPDFLLHEGHLYLKVQETRSTMALVRVYPPKDWNKHEIDELRREHPELEGFVK